MSLFSFSYFFRIDDLEVWEVHHLFNRIYEIAVVFISTGQYLILFYLARKTILFN